MPERQINIFGSDDLIENLVDTKGFSPQAQDHIRLLKNLSQEIAVLNLYDFSQDEREYVRFLRGRVVNALDKPV
ncbi:hypothetical protein CEB3_c18910 [Peptococcaceae bacterium CEB3]|nr:hypothetical protein CEB3_c18910 [Peptococcaceae bacterium CEB3]